MSRVTTTIVVQHELCDDRIEITTTADFGSTEDAIAEATEQAVARAMAAVVASRRDVHDLPATSNPCPACPECGQSYGQTHRGTCSQSAMSTGVLPPPRVGAGL